MNRIKQKILFGGTAALLLVAISIGLPFITKSKESQEFLSIFQNSREKNISYVDSNASRYILECCRNPDVALALLRESGFDVKVVSNFEEVKRLNKHWETEGKAYDQFVFAEAKPSGIMFWRIFTKYHVTLFIRENSIEAASVRSDTSMP